MGGSNFSSFSKRLEEFASRFERRGASPRPDPLAEGGRINFRRMLWNDLRDLFTRDVTRENLRDFVKRDAREAYRFYAATLQLEPLRTLPPPLRYAAMAWKAFFALANRLSPPRRIAFVLAGFASVIGWVHLLFSQLALDPADRSFAPFLLAGGFTAYFLLLLLELRDKLDLKGDLEIARDIQFGLVPREPFFAGDLSVHSYMRPANTVGGDYYDVIRLEEDCIGIVMGDVSGKGIPAALLMALIQGSVHTLTAAGMRGSELMTKLNRYLCANIPNNRLVTLFYGEIKLSSGEFSYVNAGHNAPYLLRQGQEIERLLSTSVVLGVTPEVIYESVTSRISPGDLLLLYTDGVTEAFNPAEEEYGEERLESFLRKNAAVPSPDLIRGIVGSVLAFCDSTWPRDDITMTVVRRTIPA
jgi:phosphoserine phosphatase RsbU/P